MSVCRIGTLAHWHIGTANSDEKLAQSTVTQSLCIIQSFQAHFFIQDRRKLNLETAPVLQSDNCTQMQSDNYTGFAFCQLLAFAIAPFLRSVHWSPPYCNLALALKCNLGIELVLSALHWHCTGNYTHLRLSLFYDQSICNLPHSLSCLLTIDTQSDNCTQNAFCQLHAFAIATVLRSANLCPPPISGMQRVHQSACQYASIHPMW